MNKLETDLLKILCSGSGQGNTNTNKLTEKILESNPDLEYNKAKIEIVETLRELNDSGEIRMMTLTCELGEEFLYVYENIID